MAGHKRKVPRCRMHTGHPSRTYGSLERVRGIHRIRLQVNYRVLV
jgi:hypothetical protein